MLMVSKWKWCPSSYDHEVVVEQSWWLGEKVRHGITGCIVLSNWTGQLDHFLLYPNADVFLLDFDTVHLLENLEMEEQQHSTPLAPLKRFCTIFLLWVWKWLYLERWINVCWNRLASWKQSALITRPPCSLFHPIVQQYSICIFIHVV